MRTCTPQAYTRRLLAQRMLQRMRCARAACVLQARWRGHAARITFMRKRQAAEVVQRAWRGVRAQRMLEIVRR